VLKKSTLNISDRVELELLGKENKCLKIEPDILQKAAISL